MEFVNRKATFNFYYNFFFCHLIYGVRIFENLAPDYLLNRIFLLQYSIANVYHIPYHLIQTSDLQTSLNLVPFPQLASKFTCIFGYHVLNSTCPDFFVEDFSFTHIRDSARDKNILRYHNDLLRHKLLHSLIHSRIKYDPPWNFQHSFDLFI